MRGDYPAAWDENGEVPLETEDTYDPLEVEWCDECSVELDHHNSLGVPLGWGPLCTSCYDKVFEYEFTTDTTQPQSEGLK